MLLAGRTNLRETIAFPKTASATDLLCDAPSPVTERQLDDLHVRLSAKAIAAQTKGEAAAEGSAEAGEPAVQSQG
jgi:aspartyl-tRNA synthetase